LVLHEYAVSLSNLELSFVYVHSLRLTQLVRCVSDRCLFDSLDCHAVSFRHEQVFEACVLLPAYQFQGALVVEVHVGLLARVTLLLQAVVAGQSWQCELLVEEWFVAALQVVLAFEGQPLIYVLLVRGVVGQVVELLHGDHDQLEGAELYRILGQHVQQIVVGVVGLREALLLLDLLHFGLEQLVGVAHRVYDRRSHGLVDVLDRVFVDLAVVFGQHHSEAFLAQDLVEHERADLDGGVEPRELRNVPVRNQLLLVAIIKHVWTDFLEQAN